MKCALCGSEGLFEIVSHSDAKSSEPLLIAMCRHCGLVQQSPTPTADTLRIYYSHNYRKDYKKTYTPKSKHVYRAGKTALQRLDFLNRCGIVNGTLLDVGAGGGEFVYLSGRAGFQAEGIEPNIGYSQYAKSAYGCHVITGELDGVSQLYDTITLFHVLEHLPSPIEAFEKLHSLLKQGGKLLVEVPWIEAQDASPHNIYFKAHIFYFSADTLSACASQFFNVLHIDTSSNLKILFSAKSKPSPITLPESRSVARTRKRLRSKGWLEYLFQGGACIKPVKKLIRAVEESKMDGAKPKDILDGLVEERQGH